MTSITSAPTTPSALTIFSVMRKRCCQWFFLWTPTHHLGLHDDISTHMLRAILLHPLLLYSLAMLFSLLISSSSIPSEWEPSSVVPIPKTKHPSSNPGHYRQISLLSVTSKLLERHIHGLILDHRHMHTAWFSSHSGASNILPLLSLPQYTASCS